MTGSGGLRGRQAETAGLGAAVDLVVAGSGSIVVLRGDAGIGKSTLLDWTAEQATSTGCALRSARGDELGQGRPFGPVARALGLTPDASDPGAAMVGRLLTGEEGTEPTALPLGDQLRFRVLDTVIGIVDDLTARAPLVLAIDDLHWVDDDSCGVLGALAERVRELPLLVAVATRRHPVRPRLAQLLRAFDKSGAQAIDVGPLSMDPMAAVVADEIGATPGPELLAEVARAGGNPFFAIELIRTNRMAGALRQLDNGVVDLARRGRVTALDDAVLRELDHLSATTVEMLRVASVLGRTFSLHVVAGVLDRRVAELAGEVDEALVAGLLHATGDQLGFTHDLVRESIYNSMTEAVRGALHVDAARSLAEWDAEPYDIATHIARSTGGEDAKAVAWLLRGAEQVRVSAPTTAVGFLTRAAELLDDDDDRVLAVQAQLAEALVFSGRPVEGQALVEQCQARGDLNADDRSSLAYLMGQALALQGRLADAAVEFERSTGGDGPKRPGALADAAFLLVLCGDLDRAAELAERAEDAAREGHDTGVETFVLALRSWIIALGGDLEAGLDLARRAVARADGTGDLEAHRNVPYVFYAQVLLWADRHEEALDAIERAESLGDRLGLVWDVPLRHLLRARAMHRGGEWDEAIAEARAGLSHARDLGGSIGAVWLWCVLAHLFVQRGELDEAERCLVAAEAAATADEGADQITWGRALLAEARGDLAAAAFYFDALWDALDARGLHSYLCDIAPDAVRVARRAQHKARLDQILAVVGEAAEGPMSATAAAVHARCLGIARSDPDAMTRAVALYDDVVGSARPVEVATVRHEAADVLSEAGRDADAARLRDAAHPVLAAAGAVRPALFGRDGAEIVAVGPTFGWEALTPREHEVVALLGRSMSNVQIAEQLGCSRRTVESHLSHVYTKVGLTSRVQLALEAASRMVTD